MKNFLDISWETIFKAFIAITLFYVLFSIREIIIWVVFALIIAILLEPLISFFKKRKIPRFVSVTGIYIGFLGILGYVGYLIVPFFATEVQIFIRAIPEYFEKIYPPLQEIGLFGKGELLALEESLQLMTTNVFSFLAAIFGGVVSAIFIITISYFLSLEENNIEKGIILLFPKKYEAYALSIWQKSQKKVSAWFLARIITCIFVGVVSYIVFYLFNIQYPLVLALMAGILNFIPYVGPVITGILLFFILLPITEFTQLIFVLLAFIIIQQTETSVLTPVLMKKAVGLSPALVLVALLVGAQLWGFLGAILVIPLTGILFEFTKEFLQKKKDKESVVI